MFLKAFLAILFISASLCTKGVDYSTHFSTSQAQCLVNAGYTFAIPRAYCSPGYVDPNGKANVANARAGGMKYVDIYMFPCVKCGNPGGQVDTLVNHMSGSNYGMIWVDVERYAWYSNLDQNRNFIRGIVNRLKERGIHFGIYTNRYNWEGIVGLSWSECASYPLWYAHYDNNPSFSDFRAFGGWSKPAMKQYAGDKTLCSGGVDFNCY